MVETSLMVPGTPPRSDYRVPRRPKPGVLERLPIVRFPSRRQNLRLAFGKAGMVKYDLGSGTLRHELKFRNRVDAGSPAARSPGLHDSLFGASSTCGPPLVFRNLSLPLK